MPQFRNVRSSRQSGKSYPMQYDKDGWPLKECVEPLIQHIVKEEPLDDDDLEFTYPASPRSASLVPDVKLKAKLEASYPKSEHADTLLPADTPLPARRNSHTRRRDPNHVPRPRNAFIFFRSNYINTRADGEGQQNELSKHAGKVWNKMSKEERLPFVAMASREQLEHKIRHPSYVYAPGRGGVKARQKASGRRMSGTSSVSRRKSSMASLASSNDSELAIYPGSGSSATPSPTLSFPVPPRAPRIQRVAALRAVQKFVEPSPSTSPSIAPLSGSPIKTEARSVSPPPPPSLSPEVDDFVPTSDIPILVLDPSQPMNKVKKEETPESYNHTTLPCGMDYIQEQSGFSYSSKFAKVLSTLPPLPDLKAFKSPAAAFGSFNTPWSPSMSFSALPGEGPSFSTSSYKGPAGARQLSPPSFLSLSDLPEPSLFKDLDTPQVEFHTLDNAMDSAGYCFEAFINFDD